MLGSILEPHDSMLKLRCSSKQSNAARASKFLARKKCLPVRLHLAAQLERLGSEIRNGYGDYLLQLLHERVF